MATRIALWTCGIGGFGYLGTVLFSARDEAVQKVLAEKNYADAPNEDARKKMMFMNVLQSAAYGAKPMYRQSKEDIENALSK